MTKRRRLLLAGFATILLALIPGSASADTVVGGGCAYSHGTEAPRSLG